MDSVPVLMCPSCEATYARRLPLVPKGAPPQNWTAWRCLKCGAQFTYDRIMGLQPKPGTPKT